MNLLSPQKLFLLKKTSNNNPVIVKILASSDKKTFTLTPQPDLDTATQFTATISNSVKDSEGNALTEPFSWSFSTQGTPTPSNTFTAPIAIRDVDTTKSVISPFGIVRKSADTLVYGHSGIDMPLQPGNAFYAIADGIIVEILPGSDGQPGSDIKLLIGAETPESAGWIFSYEHVSLEASITLHSSVLKGQLIARNPDPAVGNNHLQLSYWDGQYLYNHRCWVDFLESSDLLDYFKNNLRSTPDFVQFWNTVTDEGKYPLKKLLDEDSYPDGAQLCYSPGTDVRVPVE